jgi:hypothetical protein
MTPRDVREAIDCAAGKPSRVYLLKRGGNRTEVPPALRIRVVEPRGSDLVVLADAVDGDEAFAFSLHSIASVLVEGSRGIDDEIAAILGMRPRRGTHRPSARGR